MSFLTLSFFSALRAFVDIREDLAANLSNFRQLKIYCAGTERKKKGNSITAKKMKEEEGRRSERATSLFPLLLLFLLSSPSISHPFSLSPLGVWHNFVLCAFGFLMLTCMSFFLLPGFSKADGVVVVRVPQVIE